MTAKNTPPVVPADQNDDHTAPIVIVDTHFTGPDGAFYAYDGTGYTRVTEPWAVQQHIAPIERTERFADVESWVEYVKRFGGMDEHAPFLTWSETGLSAVLDYHGHQDAPGRCQWKAVQPFERSLQWKAWAALTDGRARKQKELIEALEDLGADIVEPDAAKLLTILRTLRATVNTAADTELRPDGSTKVAFTKDKTVQAGQVDLPPEIVIGIPTLKGHPVTYKLRVRVRVSVDDNAQLAFRLTIPGAERALEDVFADRVQAATEQLGEGFTLLRSSSWNG